MPLRPIRAARRALSRVARPARRLTAGATTVALLSAAALLVLPAANASAAGASATSASAADAAGASLPFTEYSAASAATNGTVLGPDYTFGTLASEATGRRAVQLTGQGSYVSFTLTAPANAVDFHYALPDSLDGSGLTAPLSLYVNGAKSQDLSLTSTLSWLYGAYTFTNNPGDVGNPQSAVPHDFYNDVRAMFPSVLPAGTVVKVQVDANDTAPWYVINTADFENVAAPLAKPAGYLDVSQPPYNADTTGAVDATAELQQAINDAETAGTGVYLPQGTYLMTSPIGLNKVGVAGAGEWYTKITGHNDEFQGNVGQTTGVTVHDLSIFSDVDHRDDSDGSVNAFNGGFNNTIISNVWIQNTKAGAWIVGATGLTMKNMRIQDTMADGINFDGGVTNSSVSNSFLRNTQDDGLAMWSSTTDSGDTFDHNTVDSPGLANNIALYGGSGNSVTDNLVQDTVTRGGGIHVGNRFGATALSGTTTISGNTLVRTGQFDPGWDYGVGAMWFFALDSAMSGTIDVTGNEIDDSPYEAFQFEGTLEGGKAISGVDISDDTVNGVGTYVFQNQTSGSVSVSGVTATGVGVAGVEDCGSGMVMTQGAGNSGWSGPSVCGFPDDAPVVAFPSTVTFQKATVGSPTPVQKVTVYNTGHSAAALSGISATGGFSVTPDGSNPCGASLNAADPTDPGMWCQIDVSYTAPASGVTTGTLTIPTSRPGSPTTVRLIGTDGGTTQVNTPVSASPGSLAFGNVSVGTTTAAKTVTVSNPGPGSVAISGVSTSGPFAQTDDCGGSLAAGAHCTVDVTFTPTAGGAQSGTLAIANSSTSAPLAVALSGSGVTATTNLAAGATITASSSTESFAPAHTNDGDTASYWESASNAFPQWLQADLGSAENVTTLVLDLPPATAWSTRTQTLSVQGSTDGSTWTTLKASADYTFDPGTGNTATVTVPTGSVRYVRLDFTANTGWPAAQLSELQIFS